MNSPFSINAKVVIVSIVGLHFVAPLPSFGLSCFPDDEQIARAEYIFSYIPMSSALDLETDKAIHNGDVRYVYKGNLNAQETVVSVLPRVLPLGDEYIIAAQRGRSGRIEIDRCTLVVETHNNENWDDDNLGKPMYEFSPRIFEPRELKAR